MQPTPSKPTLAQVRSLAWQLSPASRDKLLAELYAAEASAEVADIQAIARETRADSERRGLPPISDEDIARELSDYRAQRGA